MASGWAQKDVDYILNHQDSNPTSIMQFPKRRKVNQLRFP